jgi:hypothetical protein
MVRAVAVALLGLALVAGAGCANGSGGFPDRTARVTIGGVTTTFTVVSCGLDHQTAFVVGHAPNGSIVQAVIGVAADHHTGVPASTGITVNGVVNPNVAPPTTGGAASSTTENAAAGVATSSSLPIVSTGGFEAFGAESWQRRKQTGPAPGTITSDRIKGARIQAAGTAQPIDGADQVTAGAPVPFTFDARCDAPAKH